MSDQDGNLQKLGDMPDDGFDALTNMVLSDMQTTVPPSFYEAIGRCRCGRPKDEIHACI